MTTEIEVRPDEPWRWENEDARTERWSAAAGASAVLQVVTEVPVAKDGRRLPKRGNRYYPTMVGIRLPYMDDRVVWMSDEAREFAARLVEFADDADRIDRADADPCGHWSPCSCAASPDPRDKEGVRDAG